MTRSIITTLFLSACITTTSIAQNIIAINSSYKEPNKKSAKKIKKEEPCSEKTTIVDYAIITTHSPADTIKNDSTTSTRKTDTTEIKVGKTRIIIIGEPKIDRIDVIKEENDETDTEKSESSSKEVKKFETNFLGMDIGFNNFIDNGSLSLSAANKDLELDNIKSINLTLHLFDSRVSIYKNYVNLIYGLSIDYSNYRFTNNISLQPKKDSLTITKETILFSKNKLLSRYLTLPILLHFQSNPTGKKAFEIAGGAEVGYLIGGRTKQISDEKGKVKSNDDFNLAPLRYGFVGRIGYGNFSLYGRYYMSNLFAKNQGPALTPVAVGISIGGF